MSYSEATSATDEGEMEKAPPDGVIRFEVDKISTMGTVTDGDDRYSEEVIVKGVPWRANVCRVNVLSACLYCMNSQSTPWNIDVDAEFILVHSNTSKSKLIKDSDTMNNSDSYSHYISANFFEWDSFINNDKGFIQDDKITVEIRFWISNFKGIKIFPRIDFTDENEPSHDIALVIDGQKIHVNKGILAVNSLFFKSLFYGPFAEKDKNEIELNDVDPTEFIEMLHVIYPSCKMITEDSAEFLLKLGDRFDIQCLIDRVEMFLINTKMFTTADKLSIADKNRLFGLLEHCLSKMKTAQDFMNIKNSPIYKDLSLETVKPLFEKLLQITDECTDYDL